MNELSTLAVVLPSRRPRGEELVFRKIRKLGFPMPICYRHRVNQTQNNSSVQGRMSTEKSDSSCRVFNEFMEVTSEHVYSSPTIMRNGSKKDEIQSPSRQILPRLQINLRKKIRLPRIHTQKTTPEQRRKSIEVYQQLNREFPIRINDSLVTFYARKPSKIQNN